MSSKTYMTAPQHVFGISNQTLTGRNTLSIYVHKPRTKCVDELFASVHQEVAYMDDWHQLTRTQTQSGRTPP